MSDHKTDIPQKDQPGVGRAYVVCVFEENLYKRSIDKRPRGRPFPGVATLATLNGTQALKVRDPFDAWLKRNHWRAASGCEIVNPLMR